MCTEESHDGRANHIVEGVGVPQDGRLIDDLVVHGNTVDGTDHGFSGTGIRPQVPLAGGHGKSIGHARTGASHCAVQIQCHGVFTVVPHIGNMNGTCWRRHSGRKVIIEDSQLGKAKLSGVVPLLVTKVAPHVAAHGEVLAGAAGPRVTGQDELHGHVSGRAAKVKGHLVGAGQLHGGGE